MRVLREAGREYIVATEEIERSPFELGVHIVIASASDTGRERSNEPNEDSVAQVVVQTAHESYAEPLALGIVADGLGGHASGSEASRMVVDTVLRSILHELVTPVVTKTGSRPTDEAVKQALHDAITAANAALHAANDESKRDMGSTLVAALILGETAYIANVGDSRGYVYDGAELRRLTTDHSLVEQLVAGGMIAPEERYTHPSRNQIYRSLGVGSGDDLTADIYTQRLRPGLRLLLCSDGLWEMVHDDELSHILHEWPHPQGACDALIAAANANGGEDNISALILDVTS
jgi:serine/threonine protein phosphatase PrpC